MKIFAAIVLAVGLIEISAAQSLTDCPTNEECIDISDLLVNPANCSTFFQCAYAVDHTLYKQIMPCPSGLTFNPTVNPRVCDDPANNPCRHCSWSPVNPTTDATGTDWTEDTTEWGSTTTSPPSGDCNPNNCTVNGTCKSYDYCERTINYESSDPNSDKGHWAHEECGDGLWFNPKKNPITGGSCDLWENLSNDTKQEYRENQECIPHCEYEPIGACSSNYRYHYKALAGNWAWEYLSCGNLTWNQDKRTCDKCTNVMDTNGNGTCTVCN